MTNLQLWNTYDQAVHLAFLATNIHQKNVICKQCIQRYHLKNRSFVQVHSGKTLANPTVSKYRIESPKLAKGFKPEGTLLDLLNSQEHEWFHEIWYRLECSKVNNCFLVLKKIAFCYPYNTKTTEFSLIAFSITETSSRDWAKY